MRRIVMIFAVFASLLMVSACQSDNPSTSTQDLAAQESPQAELANPWIVVSSAQEAAEGAQLDSFQLPKAGTTLIDGPLGEWSFQHTDSIAEAQSTVGATEITVRKARNEGDGDISGDYNTYESEWTLDVNGREVRCAGSPDGASAKTLWVDGDYSYCILVRGQDGQAVSSGLYQGDIMALVSAIY